MKGEKDHYESLGVPRNATPEEIRRAYHLSARRLHPDVNVENGATEVFIQVQEAYSILSNPKERERYDATLPRLEKKSEPVAARLQFSQSTLQASEESQLLYVYLELLVNEEGSAYVSPALNISLVIDRSTSMQGERIDMVKTTTSELIRELRSNDVMSIITFSDRAEILLPAGRRPELSEINSIIQKIRPGGATEIYQGLEAGYREVRRSLSAGRINHIVLLTDGHTYGDEGPCQELAEQAATQGIGISCLGIGNEWNDAFLDDLATRTGGSSLYVSHPKDIRQFLDEKFKGLGQTFAENITLDLHLESGVVLQYAYRIAPVASRLPVTSPLRLGSLPRQAGLNVLFEFKLPPLPGSLEEFPISKGKINLTIPSRQVYGCSLDLQIRLPVSKSPQAEPPPPDLLQALSRLNLYRMQERANVELQAGEIEKATRHLQNLATHLFSRGESDLARAVLKEAKNLQNNKSISEEAKKRIKYGTRSLLLPSAPPDQAN